MSPAMGDGDINDIHQKMSRKIAQLTKVVYNLNTKCEDQDSKIRYLIEKHHAEVKHLKQLKSGPSSMEVEKAIHERVSASERAWLHEKQVLQSTVKNLKVSQSELEAQNEHLIVQKNSFEERLKIEKDEWAKERSKLVENSKRPKGLDQNTLKKIQELETQLRDEKDQLNSKISSLRLERNDLQSDYAKKFSKQESENASAIENLKALHARELQAVRISEEKELGKSESAMKNAAKLEKQVEIQEKEILRLSRELQCMKVATGEGKKQRSDLQNVLDEMIAERERLHAEMESVAAKKKNIEGLLERKNMDLAKSKEDIASKQHRLEENLARMAEMETECVTLRAETNALTLALQKAEMKAGNAVNSKKDFSDVAAKKIQDLTRQLENLRGEHQVTVEQLNTLLVDRDNALAAEKNKRKQDQQDFDRRAEETKNHFERILGAEKENLQQQFDLERENIQQMSEKFSSEQKVKFQNNIKQLEEMLITLRNEHASEKNEMQAQIAQLEKLMNERTFEGETLSGEISYLRKREKDLGEIKDEQAKKIATLADALIKSQQQVTSAKEDLESELNLRVAREESLRQSVENTERIKWEHELAEQLATVKEDLTRRLKTERADLVNQLEAEKTKEIEIVQKSWRSATEKLTANIAALEEEKLNQASLQDSTVDRLREEFSFRIKEKEHESKLIAAEFERKEQKLMSEHQSEIELLEERLMNERRKELSRIEQNSREESIEHLKSQRIAIESLKARLEGNYQKQVDILKGEHASALEELKESLIETHRSELDDELKRHEEECVDFETRMLKEQQARERLEEESTVLHEDLEAKIQGHEASLQNAYDQLQSSISENRRLILEVDRVKKIKEEAEGSFEQNVENLRKDFEVEKDNCVNESIADGLRRRQLLINDFNTTKESLMEKISQFSKDKAELEEKLENRQSLEEDIQRINRLELIIVEKEEAIDKLQNDLKYFQLELVNREQNYNALFSSNPTVGVMDPFTGTTSTRSAHSGLKHGNQRQPRFSDSFVKMDPDAFSTHLPYNRLEPIQSQRKQVKHKS